jgi:hypothetical protein
VMRSSWQLEPLSLLRTALALLLQPPLEHSQLSQRGLSDVPRYVDVDDDDDDGVSDE